jgi:hypothetical protein
MKLEENKKHRVRFFTHHERDYSKLLNSKEKQFWDVAEKFKDTLQYNWVENNDIKLQWHEDEVYIGYGRQYIIYADLNETQYTEYALRFFEFEKEWK